MAFVWSLVLDIDRLAHYHFEWMVFCVFIIIAVYDRNLYQSVLVTSSFCHVIRPLGSVVFNVQQDSTRHGRCEYVYSKLE